MTNMDTHNRIEHCDPWRSSGKEVIQSDSLFFEDSFLVNGTLNISEEKQDYVPLEDSDHYLASLEKKLTKLKGPQSRKDKLNEHRQLLNSLIQTRQDYLRRFLNSNKRNEDQYINDESSPVPVDPNSNLGNLIRKIYPDKAALSSEELSELLKSDMLAKIHESMNEGNVEVDSATDTDLPNNK